MTGRAVHVRFLYTSDAADDLLCVALGGRRIIKQKNLFLFSFVFDLILIYLFRS